MASNNIFRLFSATPSTKNLRFTQKNEAHKILKYLEQLTLKQQELKKSAAELGTDSLDYGKYIIISHILDNINAALDNFNNKPAEKNNINELKEYIKLLRQILQIVQEVNQDVECKDTLTQFRNKDRKNIRMALKIGALGVAGAAFALSGIGAGASALVVTTGVDNIVENKLKKHNELPRTYLLLDKLQQALNSTLKNLAIQLNINKLNSTSDVSTNIDSMTCPITLELMENPYMFLLDGRTYEYKALYEWLTRAKRSPVTGEYLDENEKIDDWIMLNRSLKSAIDDYRLSGKAILETENTPMVMAR